MGSVTAKFIAAAVVVAIALVALGSKFPRLGVILGPLYLMVVGTSWVDVIVSCVLSAVLVSTGIWAVNRPSALSYLAVVVAMVLWASLGWFFMKVYAA